jgi:hypothetical protein
MKSTIFVFILAAIGTFATANAQRDEIRIIANPNLGASEISRDELSRIFLMSKTSLQGAGHVEPVLVKTGPIHDEFLREYMGRTDAALMTYYRSLVFTGKASMPKSFTSGPEVTEYVSKTKGAIGFISATASTSGVKILKVQ